MFILFHILRTYILPRSILRTSLSLFSIDRLIGFVGRFCGFPHPFQHYCTLSALGRRSTRNGMHVFSVHHKASPIQNHSRRADNSLIYKIGTHIN